jgi:thioredoxin reductase
MSQYLVDQITDTKNIRVWLRSSVVEVIGDNKLEATTINKTLKGEKLTVPTGGLFIFIGAQPDYRIYHNWSRSSNNDA